LLTAAKSPPDTNGDPDQRKTSNISEDSTSTGYISGQEPFIVKQTSSAKSQQLPPKVNTFSEKEVDIIQDIHHPKSMSFFPYSH